MPQPRTNTHAGLHLLPGASDSLSVVEAWGGPGGVGFYYSAEGGTSLPRRGDYRTIGHPSSITSRHTGVFIGPQPPSPVDTPVVLWGDIIHHESTHRLFYSIGPTPRFLQTLLGPYTVVFNPRDPTNTSSGESPRTLETLPSYPPRTLSNPPRYPLDGLPTPGRHPVKIPRPTIVVFLFTEKFIFRTI